MSGKRFLPDPVVAQVQGLAAPLHAVADNGHDLILESLAGFLQGKFLRGDDLFDHPADVEL